MSPIHLDEQEIFNRARMIEQREARADYLKQVCGHDAPLFDRLVQLLGAYDEERSFLEAPPPGLDATFQAPPLQEAPGATIGPYKLLQRLDEGGMGVVYMAEQTEPVERRVALKIIKPGMDTRQVIARFEAERQALALMDHPNIAKVFDAGTAGEVASQGSAVKGQESGVTGQEENASDRTPDPRLLTPDAGRPYFVMELVKGIPITRYCDENRLTLRQRLELMLPVCHAVQHAHQKGIIHRDLKPTNVLVAEYDQHPVPKIIDFGVAKAIGQKLTERTMFTEFGQVVGTLEYMSPEQARLNQLDIDTRTDVYSLGVLLYELLTGETPLDRERLRSSAFDEMLRIIREEDPPKPSTRLSSSQTLAAVAANRHADPARLSKLVRGELDWIVMKCLEKDRSRRYETANGLALDLERYLNDEPVQACPPSAAYRFRKFAQRNRAALVAVAVVALALLLGILGTTWQAIRATGQRNRAVAAEDLAQTRLEAETVARRDANAARQEALQERDQAQRRLYEARLAQARAARWSGRPGQRFDSLDALAEAAELARALHLGPEAILELRNEAISCLTLTDVRLERVWSDWLACDPEMEFYAQYGIDDREIIVRRVSDDGEVGRVPTEKGRSDKYMVFSPNGEMLATRLSALQVSEWRRGKVVFQATGVLGDDHQALAFSPDSRRIAFARYRGPVVVHDIATGSEVAKLDSGSCIAFDPDGNRLAVGEAREVRTYDLADGKIVQRLIHPGNVTALAWHPEGRLLAAGCEDFNIYLWDLATGQQRRVLRGENPPRGRMSFTSDGQLLLSGTWTNQTHLWNPATGRRLVTCPGWVAQVSRDGRRLANRRGLWRVAPGDERRTTSVDLSAAGVRLSLRGGDISRDGRWLVAGGSGVCLWDLAQERQAAFLPIGFTEQVTFDPVRRDLLTSGVHGLHRWPFQFEGGALRLGPPERLIDDSLGSFGMDREGRILAVSQQRNNTGHGCWVLDLGDPSGDRKFLPHEHTTKASVSPDGRWVATGTWHGRGVKVWDAHSGQLVHEMLTDTGQCVSHFSPHGRWLVIFSPTQIGFWEIGSWKLVRRIHRPHPVIGADSIAWTADGALAAFSYTESQIHLFDAARDRLLAVLAPSRVGLAGFSPDGSQLVAYGGSTPQCFRIWDLRLIRRRLAEMGLDWEAPPFPPAAPANQVNPVQVEVDLGSLASELRDDRKLAQARSRAALGDALREQGKLDEAVACYREVIQIEPHNAKILNRLAWVLAIGPAEMRDAAECLKLAEQACRLDPDSPYILNTLGAAQCRAGDFREALGSLERLGGDPDFPWRTHNLLFQALCQKGLGNTASAEAAYQQAIEQRKRLKQDSIAWREAERLRTEVATFLADGVESHPQYEEAPVAPTGPAPTETASPGALDD